MPYTCCYQEKVWDLKYKKHPQGDDWYIFYIENRFDEKIQIGTIIKKTYGFSKNSWSCFSKNANLVEGFASRTDASEFLLRAEGIRGDTIMR